MDHCHCPDDAGISGKQSAGLGMIRLVIALFFAMASMAHAHETTRSYLALTRDAHTVTATLRVAFRDIEVAVWLDDNLDGQVTWAETTARMPAVNAYVLANIDLVAGGACALTPQDAGVSTQGGIDYLDLSISGTCPDATAPLTAQSRLFGDIDPDHRVFLSAQMGGVPTTAVLRKDAPKVQLDGNTGGTFAAFATYLRMGAEHLAGGADHLLFLLVLMLPAVSTLGSAQRAAVGVLLAITGFTLAHALTLTAATLQILRPPTGVIEVLIALSIVVTAIDNIRPFIPAPRAAVAAFFGLIHGFGFATVLSGLDLSGGNLVLALVGFNLGIEVAQITAVLIFMPALYMLRGGRVLLWAGSLAAGTAGLVWVWTRLQAAALL
jgi:HupE / UreJ protein